MANDSPMNSGDLIVLDIGAEFDHFCADISRTYSIGGRPTKRQEAVYAEVADIHAYACTLLKPGVLIREYEKQIETYMGEKLRQLGLIQGDERDDIRKYYPHACSHHLGLDPHDASDYDQPLEPGMVLTVEPGIYIPEEGIGVRIEDDVLITKSGIKMLTADLPAQIKA
jgi:Xaa-Pro aminopeptidase